MIPLLLTAFEDTGSGHFIYAYMELTSDFLELIKTRRAAFLTAMSMGSDAAKLVFDDEHTNLAIWLSRKTVRAHLGDERYIKYGLVQLNEPLKIAPDEGAVEELDTSWMEMHVTETNVYFSCFGDQACENYNTVKLSYEQLEQLLKEDKP